MLSVQKLTTIIYVYETGEAKCVTYVPCLGFGLRNSTESNIDACHSTIDRKVFHHQKRPFLEQPFLILLWSLALKFASFVATDEIHPRK